MAATPTHAADLGPPKQRTLLAALLWTPGSPIPADVLINRVWGEGAPRSARDALHAYIARLRRALAPGDARLRRHSGGYAVDVEPEQVDWHRFHGLVDHGRALADQDGAAASAVLREALALWGGRSLAGLGGPWVERVRETMEQEHLTARTLLAEVEVRRGRHADVLCDLAQWVAAHPLAESLVAQQMLALFRCGRSTDALLAFAALRRRTVAELGVEPGPRLRELYERILREDPDLLAPETPAAQTVVRPARLPADIADFTRRDDEVAQVRDALAEPGAVVMVTGLAGVGKSALAVHVAHQVADLFPDGRLYANLCAGCTPFAPEAVLAQFLRALGVHDSGLPPGLDERAMLLRDLVAGRRLLVVLDNAWHEDQLRPLLPGSSTGAVLVTSRFRLTVPAGARTVDLDAFGPEDAVELLGRVAGHERVNAEPAVARDVVARCGGLPLAVRVAGARLAGRPHWSLATLDARLRDERRRLSELAVGDLDVRASLEQSYDLLTEPARRALRLLGVLAAPDFSPWMLAAMSDLRLTEAEDVLGQLVEGRLVDLTVRPAPDQPARFALHELIRVFARERVASEEPADAAAAAVGRLIAELLPLLDELAHGLLPASTRLVDRAGGEHARPDLAGPVRHHGPAWLAAEEQALLTVVERAAELDLDEAACALAEALVFCWYGVRNHFDGWERSHAAALAAAERAGNRRAQAALRCGLGQARYKQDRFTDAAQLFGAAVEAYRRLGDARGEASARNGLGTVYREIGEHNLALVHLVPAAEVLAGTGDAEGAAHALYGIGFSCRELGQDARAFEYLRRAEARYRAVGHPVGAALSLRGIGLVHRARGEYEEALAWCERATDDIDPLADPLIAAYLDQAIAKARIRLRDLDGAATLLEGCLRTFTAINDRLGMALAHRTVGELHLAAGGLTDAEEHLRAALAGWDALHLPLWRARTLRDLGTVHDRRDERDAAHRSWQEAARLFNRYRTREARERASWFHSR